MHGSYDTKNYAEINLTALTHNYRTLLRHIKRKNPHAEAICVVKADAYGHGAAACVRALGAAGARFFAVSDIAEALEVRSILKDASILILGYTRPSNAPLLAEKGIIQTVHNAEYARYLQTALDAAVSSSLLTQDARMQIHIKLDSGMNRLGFSIGDADFDRSIAEILALKAYKNLSPTGVFTHFACADEQDSLMTDAQNKRFAQALQRLEASGMHLQTHAANSAAALRFGAMGYDFARLGIALYGIPPSCEVSLSSLRPVMSLYSRISEIHVLRKGESVSYGARFVAPRDMRIATVAIGYADGILRACEDGGCFIIGGKPVPIIGRICMDQCMVDLGDAEAYEGDPVTVYDDKGKNLSRLASSARTIPYELLCLTGRRVHHRYLQ